MRWAQPASTRRAAAVLPVSPMTPYHRGRCAACPVSEVRSRTAGPAAGRTPAGPRFRPGTGGSRFPRGTGGESRLTASSHGVRLARHVPLNRRTEPAERVPPDRRDRGPFRHLETRRRPLRCTVNASTSIRVARPVRAANGAHWGGRAQERSSCLPGPSNTRTQSC